MSAAAQFWSHAWISDPLAAGAVAARLEQEGWDGAVVVDSQCLRPDVWCLLTLCAQATRHLQLSPGITNPITRHPSVTASAAATVQAISGGRVHLGIGRGDSALAHIGAAPMAIGLFEPYLALLQSYLRGELVELSAAAALLSGATANFDKLALATPPPGSRIHWLANSGQKKVPLEPFVTGPKAIAAAAKSADTLILGVGADFERLQWAAQTARQAIERAGRGAQGVGLGAYVCVVPHHDIATARQLGTPLIASISRFSVINKNVVGPASAHQRQTLEHIARVYDMNAHGQGGAQAAVIDARFIDEFAVVGPVARCLEQLRRIVSLGFQRLVFSTPPRSADPASQVSWDLLTQELLPALRQALV